jgi:hypothetical protein
MFVRTKDEVNLADLATQLVRLVQPRGMPKTGRHTFSSARASAMPGAGRPNSLAVTRASATT